MKLSGCYGKTIRPACQYCLYSIVTGEPMQCEKGNHAAPNDSCRSFRYEPTLREPKLPPSLGSFQPEDFQL